MNFERKVVRASSEKNINFSADVPKNDFMQSRRTFLVIKLFWGFKKISNVLSKKSGWFLKTDFYASGETF